jgi:tetratricopeptide (TPR) repeat protein
MLMALVDFLRFPARRRRRPETSGRVARVAMVLGAALALALLTSACSLFQSEDVRLAHEGAEAMAMGNYAMAEARFQEAIAINPANTPALLNLGVVYQNTGRDVQARAAYLTLMETERRQRAIETVDPPPGVPPPLATPATLARENLADLDLQADYAAWYADLPEPGSFEPADVARIQSGLTGFYRELAGMAERLGVITASLDPDRSAAATLAEAPPDVTMSSAPEPGAAAADAAADGAPLALTGDAGAPEPPAQTASLDADAGVGGLELKVHIASFRSEERARRGWDILAASHSDLLAGFALDIKQIDLGPGLGVFFRVRATPLATEAAAKQLCRSLKERDVYCAVSYF